MTDALLKEANSAHRAGKIVEAAELYNRLLRDNPQHFDALHGLGLIYFRTNQFALAQDLIGEALKLDPLFFDGHCLRGAALANLRRYDEALACFDQAASIKPDSIAVLSNRATVLLQMNRFETGLAELDRVLAIDPTHATSLNNRGNALTSMSRYQEAVSSFDRAVAIQPQRAVFWVNRGRALSMLGRRAEALSSFERALAIDPRDITACEGRAIQLFSFKRYEEAANAFETVLPLDPNRNYAKGYLFQSRLYCCDWRDFHQTSESIASDLSQGKAAIIPMALTNFSRSAADQMQCAKLWTANEFPASRDPLWNGEQYNHDKTRLAYLSPEFSGNPVATQLIGVLEHHDKARFETTAIAFGHDDNSPMRLRAQRAFDNFIDVRGKRDDEVAAFLRQREVDIVIDLAGHTGNCRTGVVARRAAPIQVNYLGFPATMGTPYVDYIIADRTIIPDQLRHHYSEEVVQLPDTYMPTDATRKIAERTPSRAEAGLPDMGFVFCSFNNSFKIAPDIFDVWMELLREVEGSVLWLPQFNSAAIRNLRNEAVTRGVVPSRLVFAPYLESEDDHLARYRLADLFLDTFPYNAHSTACDAIWVGLPVLTCMGETFSSRVAASVLNAIGMQELVTDTLADYRKRAFALARDPVALCAIRAELAENRATCPLFDTVRFTRNLEAAYVQMLHRFRDGEAPKGFAISEVA